MMNSKIIHVIVLRLHEEKWDIEKPSDCRRQSVTSLHLQVTQWNITLKMEDENPIAELGEILIV